MKHVNDVKSNIEPFQAHAEMEYFLVDYQEKCTVTWMNCFAIESPPNPESDRFQSLWSTILSRSKMISSDQ